MGKGLITMLLLIISNSFMTWPGAATSNLAAAANFSPIFRVILSWLTILNIAPVPAQNRFQGTGGPLRDATQDHQEVITLVVFVVFATIF